MKNRVIILGGPGGTGRTTLTDQLAKALNLRSIHGGIILRQVATELGYEPDEAKIVQFHQEYLPDHPEVDLEVDAKLFEEALKGNIIMESMTFAPITHRLRLDYLRIWVTATEEERARRICKREAKKGNLYTIDKMMEITRQRLDANQKRYQALYGFDFLDVDRYYTLSFDTTNVPEDEMANRLLELCNNRGINIC